MVKAIFVAVILVSLFCVSHGIVLCSDKKEGTNMNESWLTGPSFHSRERLLEWLKDNAHDENGERRLFRLPLVIEFKDDYRLEIARCYPGNKERQKDEDVVLLQIDDTGMGIDFISQVRSLCPKDRRSCVVLVEGFWGPLIDVGLNLQPAGGEKFFFSILRVLGLSMDDSSVPLVRKK
mgnify:CR=1 FL=1